MLVCGIGQATRENGKRPSATLVKEIPYPFRNKAGSDSKKKKKSKIAAF